MPKFLACLVLLAACVDPDEVCAEAQNMFPTVEIGTGESAFEPIPEEPLRGYFGAQGGYHLWISLRTVGIAPTRLGAGVKHPPPFVAMELVDNANGEIAASLESDWTPLLGTLEQAEAAGLTLFISQEWEFGGQDAGADFRTGVEDGTLDLTISDYCDGEVTVTRPLSFTL